MRRRAFLAGSLVTLASPAFARAAKALTPQQRIPVLGKHAPAVQGFATRYVATTGNDSTGTGSFANPYLTMTKADSVSTAGDVVIVQSGTYTLPVGGWQMQKAGVRFKSATKYGAKIVPPSSSSNNVPFWFSGANQVIDGFEVDATGVTVLGTGLIGVYITGSNSNIHGAYVTNQGGVCTNCLIYHCTGWGIITFHDGSNCTIANNTVFNNDRGGISISGGGNYNLIGNCVNCKVFNNIIYDNTTGGTAIGLDEFGTVSGNFYDHNIIASNSVATQMINGTVTNTIITTPTFVNYIRTGGGDYHSLSTSPQVDAGVASFNGVAAPSIDLDGTARPQGAAYDIGCYER